MNQGVPPRPVSFAAYWWSRLPQASKEERLEVAAKRAAVLFKVRYAAVKAQTGLKEGKPVERLMRYEARPYETWAWFAVHRRRLFKEQANDYGALLEKEGEKGLLTVQRIEQYEDVRRLEVVD